MIPLENSSQDQGISSLGGMYVFNHQLYNLEKETVPHFGKVVRQMQNINQEHI